MMMGPTPGKKLPGISKRELEEQKKKQEEHDAAAAFEEYLTVFQENPSGKAPNKVWVKAGTYDAGRRHEDTREKGKLYKPISRFEKEEKPVKPPEVEDARPDRLGKKKEKEKKKSNLEIFKEELKIIQEEREERHRLKNVLGLQEVIKLPPKPGDDLRASLSLELDDVKMGSIDDGDPNTTNIYLGNLPTKISEQQLMDIFGKFGPLASVKVMWPRTEEEKARNRLSGFVAYMSRRDGERALKHLAGCEILGSEIKLGWGKAVPIPAYPVYIPPEMLELTMPPPLSGLPFNGQPDRRDKHKVPPPGTPYPTDARGKEEFEKIVHRAVVKVVMPTDRLLLALIHRMVEFVAREGPMFEAMIMNREINNPQYRFLFENQSPAHIYYRWKLFSILQGESTQRWRTEDFRMFKGGSVWRPPNVGLFTQGMPADLVPEEDREARKGSLSNAQRNRLERMLRGINLERHKISEVMIFCIEHAESANEICQCIKESLCNPKTALTRKIGRLYIISDILHNCSLKGMNAFAYRKFFKGHLPACFQEIHFAYQTALGDGDLAKSTQAESFKQRVMACFRAWEEWGIYPQEFLIRLQNIFLGLITVSSREEEEKILEGLQEEDEEEIMRKCRKSPPRATMPPKSAINLVKSLQSLEADPELDGLPMEELGSTEANHSRMTAVATKVEQLVKDAPPAPAKGGFIPSKWETVDPEEVKAQAVTTTSKWDLFEENSPPSSEEKDGSAKENGKSALIGLLNSYADEDADGVPMDEDESPTSREVGKVGVEIYEDEVSEERRLKLRQIENKVLAFQDELESGRKKIKPGETIQSLVTQYRARLLKKSEREKLKREYVEQEEEYEDDEDQYSSSSSSRKRHSERDSSRSRHDRDRGSDRRSERDREPRSDRDKSRRYRTLSPDEDYDDRGHSPPSSRSASGRSNRKYDNSEPRSPNRSRRSRSRSPRSSARRSRSRSSSPRSSRRHRHKHKN